LARRPEYAQLQRVYGTVGLNQKELDQYLFRLEEAERRDHRRLGASSTCYTCRKEAVGSIFWHPKGWKLFGHRGLHAPAARCPLGYRRSRRPQLLDRSLWRDGHWENFRENMFIAESRTRKFSR